MTCNRALITVVLLQAEANAWLHICSSSALISTTPAVQNSICKQWLRAMQFSVCAKMSPSIPLSPTVPKLHRVLHDRDAVYPKRQQRVETFAYYAATITGSTAVLSVHCHRQSTQCCRPVGPLRAEAHPATCQLELLGTVRSQTHRPRPNTVRVSTAHTFLRRFQQRTSKVRGPWTCTYKSSCVVIAGVAWIPDLEALRKARRRPPLDSAACSNADAFPFQYRNFDATLPSRGGRKGANSADPWWYSCSRPALLHHSFFSELTQTVSQAHCSSAARKGTSPTAASAGTSFCSGTKG